MLTKDKALKKKQKEGTSSLCDFLSLENKSEIISKKFFIKEPSSLLSI